MIDIKADFSGGLNLDDALYNVPKNAYIDAMNVTTDAIEGSNDRAVTNIVGNQLVEYDFPTVALFPEVVDENIQSGGKLATISFTGLILANTVITITIKDSDDNIVTIGSYTIQQGDSLLSVYTGLKDSINETGAPGVVLANVVDNQLKIEHESSTYITKENVEIVSSEGENVCIGAFPNNVTNTVIYFVWNSLGFHSVLEYENTNRTISPVFINLTDSDNVDILNFDRNKKITSINIYNRDENAESGGGDLLFFLDSLGRPTTIDVKRFKDKEYSPVTREILDVCKRPPLFPPDVLYGNDASRNTNNLRNRLFRFKYRYVYDNNEKSVCSPISTLPLPINILDEEYNAVPSNNNKIDIQLNTGDKDVKSIELLMSYVLKTNDWSDFALVENIDKNKITFLSASKISEDNPIGSNIKATIKFSGAFIPGTIVNIILRKLAIGFPRYTVGTYTIKLGDSVSDLTSGLVSSLLLNPSYVTSPSSPTSDSVQFFYDTPFSIPADGVQIIFPSNPSVDNSPFIYSFYNDGTYPVIDVAESTQIFDYVPDLANAQEMANGNVLIYGGITEGYNRNLEPNVVNEILTTPAGSNVSFFSVNVQKDGLLTIFTFNGIPLTNTNITIYIKQTSTGNIIPIAQYDTLEFDDILKVSNALSAQINASSIPAVSSAVFPDGRLTLKFNSLLFYRYESIVITPPSFTFTDNSIPTFLFSTTRRLGIAYFDKKGKTNGILYSTELNFPKYEENEDEFILVPYINTKIYHTPPIWAHSYGFYLTKEATQFLYWESIKVEEDTASNDLYFNISNLGENQKLYPTTTNVLNYTFQDGDRLRLIKRINISSPEIFPIDCDAAIIGQVIDPKVNNIVKKGTFIKIKKIDSFNITYNDDHFIIQLYRPTQQLSTGENEVYYEFGQQYGIGDAELSTRYHMGIVSDQGRVPTNAINCNVSIVQFADILKTSVLQFAGVPFFGTQINITITILPNTITDIASYTIQIGDTLTSVIDNLLSQLSSYVGSYLSSATKDGNNISISYSPTLYSLLQSNVVFTYPPASEIPAEFNFYGGDVYIRPRVITTFDGQPTSLIGYSIYNTLDRNFLDNYISAVNNIDGRPSVIDANARRAYYSTMVRFGQAYQPNTNINGLNRFFPANFDEYDYSYGDIMRLKVRDRFIRVFQKLKVGKVPLYSQIVKDPANAQNLIVSDKLINPISYYVGDLGIGEHAESLISYNYADYFTSNIKGIVARVGEEGVSFLSIDNKMDSWATSNLPLRTGDYKVYGGLDQRIGNYIIALEATDTDPAVTLVFDLDLKCFSTFLSYHPEMMTVLGTLFISFKNGNLYTHDNFEEHNTFYGEDAADSSITPVFNANPLDKKTFISIGEVASQIWDAPVIKTDLNSYGTTKMESNLVDADFVELEGTFEAPILRDVNSIGGILEGDSMKGKYMTMKFRAKSPTSLVSLNLLSLKSINSPLNNR